MLCAAPAWAQTSTWTGLAAPNSNWATPGNWDAGVPGSGGTALFNGPGNGNTSIGLGGGSQPIHTIQFDAGAAAYTIGQSSEGALNFDPDGFIIANSGLTTAQTFNAAVRTNGPLSVINAVSNGQTKAGLGLTGLGFGPITLGGALILSNAAATVTTALNGDITETGSQPGNLTLLASIGTPINNFVINGNNSYTGGTTIAANTGANGGIYIGSDTAFGAGKITVNSSASNPVLRAHVSDRMIVNAIDVNQGIDFDGTNSITLTGPLAVASTGQNNGRLLRNFITGGTLTLGASDGSSVIYLGNPGSNGGDGVGRTIIISAQRDATINVNARFQDVDATSAASAVNYSGQGAIAGNPGKGNIIINVPQTYTSPTRTGSGQVTVQFKHDTVLNGSTIVSGPFGVGTFHSDGANNAQLVPIGDDRTIANPILLEFGLTVDNLKDSSGNTLEPRSVTFTGPINFTSTASRLIQSKMHRTTGGTLIFGSASNPSTFSLVLGPTGATRNLSFDNQGRTVVNDTIQDVPDPSNPGNTTPVNIVINSNTSITTFNGDQNTNGDFTVNGTSTANPVAIINGNRSGSGMMTTNGTLVVNGAKTGSGAVSINGTGTLGGAGSIDGPVTNNGTIAPGNAIGTLTLTDNVAMGSDSHLAVELSGTSADRLFVGGNLDLLKVDFLDVTGAGSGSSWVIATYGGTLSGVFDKVTPGFTVDYGTGTNSQITLMAVGLPGDWNGDSSVDAADYVAWRKDPVDNGGNPEGYNIWRQNFGRSAGGGSGLDVSRGVPEPAVLLLVFLASGGLQVVCARRRIAAFERSQMARSMRSTCRNR
jgi:hypothetical protein